MNEQELERALRHALRPVDPGESFSDRVMASVDASAATPMEAGNGVPPVLALQHAQRRLAARWGPLALAACVIAGIGLVYWRQQALEQERALEARAQLLQALSIVSASVDTVRDAVVHEEEPIR